MDRKEFMKDFIFNTRSKLNPEDFDAFVQEDLAKAATRAKLLLGVDDYFINEFNPIFISVPAPATNSVSPVFVYGQDKLRYDLASFFAVFFGKDYLFYYSCLIDHKSGSGFNDKTIEIPYGKIESLETSSRFTMINEVEHHLFEVKIILDGLDNIVIPLRALIVDEKTTADDYLIAKELLDLSASLKGFLRNKMKL